MFLGEVQIELREFTIHSKSSLVLYVFQASLQQKCPHTLMIVRSGKNIIDRGKNIMMYDEFI